DYIKSRADAGLATQANVLEAQAAHDLALADQTTADNTLAAARMTLEALTGKSYPEIKVLPPNIVLSPPQPLDEKVWVERALTENPSILAQNATMEVAKVDRRIVQRERYPKIDIVGTAYTLDNGGGITGERNEDDMRIGVKMSLPLFTGGQISAAIRGALEMEKKAEADTAAVRIKTTRDTRIANLNSSAGLQRVLSLRRAVEAAVAAENSARAGYDAGTLTNADVLDAIDRRYKAEASYAASRYQFLTSSLRLKQLSGNLLTADLAQINRWLQSPQLAPPPTQH
ncbi:MAG: TolC family protein, partial [Solimonas sp.]